MQIHIWRQSDLDLRCFAIPSIHQVFCEMKAKKKKKKKKIHNKKYMEWSVWHLRTFTIPLDLQNLLSIHNPFLRPQIRTVYIHTFLHLFLFFHKNISCGILLQWDNSNQIPQYMFPRRNTTQDQKITDIVISKLISYLEPWLVFYQQILTQISL